MLAAVYWTGMTLGAASGMTRPGGGTEVWQFGAAAANHPSPSGCGRAEVIAIGIIKIKIIFYNMKCKDVLDMKLPVAGENEIA